MMKVLSLCALSILKFDYNICRVLHEISSSWGFGVLGLWGLGVLGFGGFRGFRGFRGLGVLGV